MSQSLSKKQLLAQAEYCKKNGLDDLVMFYMKEVLKSGYNLEYFERKMLFSSISSKKKALFNALDELSNSESQKADKTVVKSLQSKLKQELWLVCQSAIKFLGTKEVRRDLSPEAAVDYLIFEGAQFASKARCEQLIDEGKDERRKRFANEARSIFEKANRRAVNELEGHNVVRMNAAIQLAKLYLDQFGLCDEASILANDALVSATTAES